MAGFDVLVMAIQNGIVADTCIFADAEGLDSLIPEMRIASPKAYINGKLSNILEKSFGTIIDIVAEETNVFPSGQLLKIFMDCNFKPGFTGQSFNFEVYDTQTCYYQDATTTQKAQEQGISVGSFVYIKYGRYDPGYASPVGYNDGVPKVWVPGSVKVKTVRVEPNGAIAIDFEENVFQSEYPTYLIDPVHFPKGLPVMGYIPYAVEENGPEQATGYYMLIDSSAIESLPGMEADPPAPIMSGGQIVFKGDCPPEIYGQTLHDRFTTTNHLHVVKLSPDSLSQERSFEGVLKHFYLTPEERLNADQLHTPQIIRDISISTKIPGTTILNI